MPINESGDNEIERNTKTYQYFIINRTHRNLRRDFPQELAAEYSALGLSPEERMTRRFELLCQAEKPQIQPFEKIVLMRTVKKTTGHLYRGGVGGHQGKTLHP